MPLSTIVISWWSVLLVEKTGVPGIKNVFKNNTSSNEIHD
jgi:hypothetical protein